MPEASLWTRRTEPADLPEWMDDPCSFEDLRACLNDLGQVNRLTFGYRPTLAFLQQIVSKHSHKAPLRILDVGCGGGDALRRIARWAQTRNIAVALTGIDLSPLAIRAAQEWSREMTIGWLCGHAFSYAGPADIIISSLLTHHLSSPEVVRFITWMEHTAQLGWFINDLERSPRACAMFKVLARIARWHRFVQHDGPVSFRRSFAREDWQRLIAAAGLPADVCSIESWRPGRLCVSRFK